MDDKFQRWPNQINAINGLRKSFRTGHKFPTVVSPTGTGKSVIIRDIIRNAMGNSKSVALVVHRRILRDQLIQALFIFKGTIKCYHLNFNNKPKCNNPKCNPPGS